MSDSSLDRSLNSPPVDKAAAQSSTKSERPNSISGKRLTVTVLIILLITGGLFYWVTTAYGTYNAARRETDRAWRELAPELDKRYRAIGSSVSAAESENKLEPRSAQQWKMSVNEFSGSSHSLRQIEAAQQLEALVATFPPELRAQHMVSPRLDELAQAYATAAARQRSVGRTMGSRLLKSMLYLPEPDELTIAK